jgi:hypothetical protein
LRRAITPNPETAKKEDSMLARRAITPNPEYHPQPDLFEPQDYNNYQNIEAFQHLYKKSDWYDDLDSSGVSEDHKPPTDTASTSSSSPDLKIKMAPGANVPGKRDSGNWSGDRNSASSSSSTSMDNPYLFLTAAGKK